MKDNSCKISSQFANRIQNNATWQNPPPPPPPPWTWYIQNTLNQIGLKEFASINFNIFYKDIYVIYPSLYFYFLLYLTFPCPPSFLALPISFPFLFPCPAYFLDLPMPTSFCLCLLPMYFPSAFCLFISLLFFCIYVRKVHTARVITIALSISKTV